MAPKTIKGALVDMLENLSEENFDKFCRKLLDRREEPKVRRRQVEGKNFLDIADLLVSVFTEAKAHLVAVELLKDISCGNDAAELESVIAGLSSNPGSSGDKHFVDEHKTELIQRVSNIDPILDELLEKGVIQQEPYDEIRRLPTSPKKMRELYSGCLKSGTASKDVFYKSLEKHEIYLIDDLKKKS